MGVENDTAVVENSIVVLQKIKNRITIWPSNSASKYIPLKIESRILKRYLHICVHWNIISISKIWKQPKCLFIDK